MLLPVRSMDRAGLGEAAPLVVLQIPMNSMTGFGSGTAQLGPLTLTVEITSLNNRGLEISCSGTKSWIEMETALQQQVRKRLKRGKLRISVDIHYDEVSDASDEDSDAAAVGALCRRLEKLSQRLDVPFALNTTLLFEILRFIQAKTHTRPLWETVRPLAETALEAALVQLQKMRALEGATLCEDLRARLEKLNDYLAAIRDEAPKSVSHYREGLLRRLAQAELSLDLDDERVLKEIALFADRCDISEEMTRLDSHLKQIQECLNQREPVGRKMEFLLQELQREIHTIGSKAASLPITRKVAAFKNELECIREQIQNLE